MEVTRTNFQEVLAELQDVLKAATFLSMDGEFTGLNSGPDAGIFDTPAQYYSKLRSGSMDFLLVQFGLSVFTYNPDVNKYSQRSYNFYVFPQPLNRSAPDCRFLCQASSISFLANQGFDFNKLFKLGIPYLTSSEEEELTKKMEEKQKMREEGLDVIPIPEEHKPHIEEICTRIDDFIDSDQTELLLDKCNPFIRRLVHQEARIRWPTKLRIESQSDGSNYGQNLVIKKTGTKEEEARIEAERRDKEKLELQQAVGLSVLLRMIADSGKLLVGHNMLLDLCHIIHQFFSPLPQNYQEFKSLVNCLFPRLLDTKVICHAQQFKDIVMSSNLNVLLETMNKAPFCIPEVESVKGRSYSTSIVKAHEAGYDAYITGLCFIALSNYLGTLQKPEIDTVLPDSPLLNPFLNKLVIPRLMKDIPYLNLVGDDPNPNRDHVFHVRFPKEWKYNDLNRFFSAFGGISVSWISDTSAYVGLYRREQAPAVIKSLKKSNLCKIQKYAEHQAFLNKMNSMKDKEIQTQKSDRNATSRAREEKSPPHKDETKTNEEEGGWEIATGKRKRKRKLQPDAAETENPEEEKRKKTFPENDTWN